MVVVVLVLVLLLFVVVVVVTKCPIRTLWLLLWVSETCKQQYSNNWGLHSVACLQKHTHMLIIGVHKYIDIYTYTKIHMRVHIMYIYVYRFL